MRLRLTPQATCAGTTKHENLQRNIIFALNQRGLTLVELTLATALIGIVMVGVTAFGTSMKGMEDSTSKGALLAMRASAAMAHIRRNAAMAVGLQSDPGVRTGSVVQGGKTWNYFSFRQEANVPGNTCDDTWVIYTDGGTAGRMYACQQAVTACPPADTGFIPNNAAGTPCADPTQYTLLLQNTIGTISRSFQTTQPLTFRINLEIWDNVADPCVPDPTCDPNPLKNPSYSLNTSMALVSHSW